MPRAPVQELQVTEAIRPVAAQVDSFVQAPVVRTDNRLGELAKSLQYLEPGLRSLVTKRDAEAEAKASQAAKVAKAQQFQETNKDGIAEGVRQGAIPAHESPDFEASTRQAQGAVKASALERQFEESYAAWDGKTSTDPQALNGFLAQFIGQNVGPSEDPSILGALLPRLRAIADRAVTRQTTDASEAARRASTEAHAAEAGVALDDARNILSGPVDYAGVFATQAAVRDRFIKSGGRPEEIDPKLIDTVAAKAQQAFESGDKRGSDSILGFFDTKVPGTETTWGQTPYGAEVRQRVADHIAVAEHTEIEQGGKRQAAEDKAEREKLTRSTLSHLAATPDVPIPEEVLARGALVDPEWRDKAQRWQERIQLPDAAGDQDSYREVVRSIARGGGIRAIQKGFEDGAFGDADALRRANQLEEAYRANKPAVEDAFQGRAATFVTQSIRAAAADPADVSSLFHEEGLTVAGDRADAAFRQQVVAWIARNPEASLTEREKAIADIGSQIVATLPKPAQTPTPAAPPEAPAAPTAPAAASQPAKLPEAQPSAPPPEPEARVQKASATVADPAASRGWVASLPVATKQAIVDAAAARGIPPDEWASRLYQQGVSTGVIKPSADTGPALSRQEARAQIAEASGALQQLFKGWKEGQPIPPEALNQAERLFQIAIATDGPSQRNYALAVLNDDPKAASILDFVAGAELGEGSNGNYNAYFGKAGSTKDLSKMTFDEVVAWSGNRGTKSSATGRYQFMKATLAGLKDEMGIDGKTRFTPELQDRMAIHLLNRRGYQEWLNGKLTKEQFANNLAREWASLPNITAQNGRPAGVSAYAGDGLNKSQTTSKAVLAALGSAAKGSSNDPASTIPARAGAGSAPLPYKDLSSLSTYRRANEKLANVRALVLHHTVTSGSPEEVIDILNKRRLGIQYIMDRKGEIYQGLPDGSRGAHIHESELGDGLSNDNTIGLEVIAKDDSDVTPAQVAAALRFAAEMEKRHPGLRVVGHGEINSHKQKTEGATILSAYNASKAKAAATPAKPTRKT